MNKKDKKALQKIIEDLNNTINALNEISICEQEKLDNLNTFFENTLQVQDFEDNIEILDGVTNILEMAILELEEIG